MKLRKQAPLKLAAFGLVAALFACFYALVQAEEVPSDTAQPTNRVDYESFFAPSVGPRPAPTPDVQPRPHTRTRAS